MDIHMDIHMDIRRYPSLHDICGSYLLLAVSYGYVRVSRDARSYPNKSAWSKLPDDMRWLDDRLQRTAPVLPVTRCIARHPGPALREAAEALQVRAAPQSRKAAGQRINVNLKAATGCDGRFASSPGIAGSTGPARAPGPGPYSAPA